MHGEYGQLGKRRPGPATEEAEHQSLRQHLPYQTHPPRTERRPYRELLLAAKAARDQQVGDVGAGNQEHQRQGAEQGVEHWARRPGQHFLVRSGTEGNGVAGVRSRDMRGNGVQFVLRLHRAHSGAKLSHDVEEVIAPVFEHCLGGLQREPNTFLHIRSHFFRKAETAWHDADHRVRCAANLNHLAHDTRVGVKALPP